MSFGLASQVRDMNVKMESSPTYQNTIAPGHNSASYNMDASEHAHAQSRSPDIDAMDQDGQGSQNADGQNGASSNSDAPARKRRRSRKGLDKRFECTTEGCGKSYSRAEHL